MTPSCPLTPWSIHLNIVNLVIIGEMAQWLTVLAAPEELGSIPSIHMVTYTEPGNFWPEDTEQTTVYLGTCSQNTQICIFKNGKTYF